MNRSAMNKSRNTSNYILSLADRCVKCGLCLPQCPTYALSANENESPRGRIALIQGWLTDELSPSENLIKHLDQCLLCRRCERICPSMVPYGEIMDESKVLLTEKTKQHFSFRKFITTTSLNVLLNKKISGYLISTLRLFQKTGVFFLAKKSRLLNLLGLQRLVAALPILGKTFKPKKFYPAVNPRRGTVALFTGCLSDQFDPKTVKASILLLNQLGYDVHIPPQQTCCGALHLHDGNKQHAVKLANNNISTFNQQNNITAVISLVNGCTSQLREYSLLNTSNAFNAEVKDIIEFLSEIDWPNDIKFKPLNKTVALQIPCSLQNTLRAEAKLMTLLQKIPGINLPQDTIYNRCCGAAGSYFLRFPQLSDQLKNSALDKLVLSTPELIISSNLGCALQLKAGLLQRNSNISIIHPVLLLEQQLKSS